MRKSPRSSNSTLESYVEVFLPAKVQGILQFLVESKNLDGGWGRLKDAPSEVRNTALAVLGLYTGDYDTCMAACEEGIHYLFNAVRELQRQQGSITSAQGITEIALMAEALAKIGGTRHVDELNWCLDQIRLSQANDGSWGKIGARTQETAMAARALALSSGLSENVSNATSFLLSIQNKDGGWGVSRDLPSSVGVTSQVLRMLAAGGYPSEGAAIENATSFLSISQNHDGSWSESGEGNVYHTALCILSMREYGVPIEEQSIRRGVSFLESIQNDDHGWGWKAGETSQTEPTSYALMALVTAGVKEYVPFVFVRTAMASVNDETRVLKQELAQLRSNLDARVREQIPGVIKERDQLFQEAKELRTAHTQETKRRKEETDRLRAMFEDASRENRIRIETMLSEARDYSASVEEGVSRLRTGAMRLLISWSIYGLVLTSAVLMVLSGRTPSFITIPLGVGIVTALTVILIGISILVWRRYGRLDIATRAAHMIFRLKLDRMLETPLEDLRRGDVRPRETEEAMYVLRRAFERLGMILRELPPSQRYELLRTVEYTIDAPPDMRRLTLRQVLDERREMIPPSMMRELDRALYELSRVEVPSRIMRSEYMRLRESVLDMFPRTSDKSFEL